MESMLHTLMPVLVSGAPLLLWLAGLWPGVNANKRPQLVARLNSSAAWLAFVCALMAVLLYGFTAPHTWTLFSVDLPGDIGAFSIGAYLNGVTAIMLVLVSFVGAVVSRYSQRYLAGDANQGSFYRWLNLTLASILTLIVSSNLLMFSLAWISTSLCLHQLLVYFHERPAAVLASHKKFVASRIGDASLLSAIVLIGSSLHTLEFEEIFHVMAAHGGPLPGSLQWATWLIVVSAALKSAQFPFHGWLIQVMEAPTPVSALLHAGIVNAGAFLVIRMSPIMSLSETALMMLATIGLVTLALAAMVMLTQTSIKVSLAWSTTAQMGFMLLECGLGLYSLAMLHLVAHSLYKAHAFLSSGSSVDGFRAPHLRCKGPRRQALFWAAAMGMAILITSSVGAAFGVTPKSDPALFATAIVVAIAVSQLLLQALVLGGWSSLLWRALGLGAVICLAYFSLHALFERALVGSVLPLPDPAGRVQTVFAILVIGVFLGLSVAQVVFKSVPARVRDSLYTHLYNGLYIDVFITRGLQKFWPAPELAPNRGERS